MNEFSFALTGLMLCILGLVICHGLKVWLKISIRNIEHEELILKQEQITKDINKRLEWKLKYKTPILSYGSLTRHWHVTK